MFVLFLSACAPAPVAAPQIITVKETVVVAGTPQMIEVTKVVEAKQTQTLRIITGSSMESSFMFNTLGMGGDLQNWQTLLYIPPMYFDKDLNLKPGIFASWDSNDTKDVWTFKIDPRAKFSDGSPVTAADVKGTWEIQSDLTNNVGRARGYFGNIKGFTEVNSGNAKEISGIEIVDEKTIKVNLVKPDPIFNYLIATTHTNTINVAQYHKFDWATWWLPENKPLSTGPFVLSEYSPDLRTAKMVKNPNWWMEEGPYIDEITFIFVVDQQTMAAMLMNDQADVSQEKLAPEMEAKMPEMFTPIKAFGYNAFWLNVNAEPTNDINVRKALAMAVDWNAVFKATFPGKQGAATNQILDPDFPCIDKTNSWYTYDPEAAKAALAASTYKNAAGLPKLRITPRGGDVYNMRALEAIMGFWKDNLGITNIEFKQSPSEFGEENLTKINLTRDDVVIRFPDSATYMWNTAYSTGPGATGLMNNYKNPEVDKLLDQAMVTFPEDAKRCELTLAAQKLFMDDYAALPFGKRIMSINARSYVKDYFKGPDVTLIEPWKIKLEK